MNKSISQTAFLRYIYLTVAVVFFHSCTTKDTPTAANEFLVSSELVKSYTAEEYKKVIDETLGSQGGIPISQFVQSGIEQYKITYKTKDVAGNAIIASGAFIIPKGDVQKELTLGSLQHGTIFDNKDAPSFFGQSTEATLGSILASTGMMIALPDYVGYGASANLEHPYEHNAGLANPSVDFLRSIKEDISDRKLNWNKKLLLAGYSEGGYATMALHKKLETEFPSEFNVVLSSIGAGAYNKTATVLDFVNNDTSGDPTHTASYIWVLRTYNQIEGLNRKMSDFFIEPFASDIEKNGHRVTISKSFKTLLQPAFIAGIKSGTDTGFLNAIKKNDVYDWKPKATVIMYHGTADEYVPFLNSQTALDAMKKNGAADVSLIPILGGDHGSSLATYSLGTLQSFLSNR